MEKTVLDVPDSRSSRTTVSSLAVNVVLLSKMILKDMERMVLDEHSLSLIGLPVRNECQDQGPVIDQDAVHALRKIFCIRPRISTM